MFDFKGLIGALFQKKEQEGVHDLKSATTMMRELPESDILNAQIEIVKALQQLNSNPSIPLKERLRTIPYLDEKARSLQTHLIDIYYGRQIDTGTSPKQVLPTILAFWNDMGEAYRLCLKQASQTSARGHEKQLQLCALRAMRYFGEHIKWAYLRYLEIDPRTWRRLNKLYQHAEQHGFAMTPQQAYPDSEGGTIRHEFLRIQMLSLANPDKLQPEQIELLANWLGEWSHRIDLEDQIRPNRQLFAVNIAGTTSAKRLRRDMVGENWRYWYTEALIQHIKDVHDKLRSGVTPDHFGLPAASAKPANLDLLQELLAWWSRDTPAPVRKTERHASDKKIHVLRGFDAVLHKLGSPDSRINRYPQQQWHVVNESATGIGASYQGLHEDHLRVGEIVGLSDGPANLPSIGIVRRINKRLDGQVNIGIETLTHSPILVELAPAQGGDSRQALYSPENTTAYQSRFLMISERDFAEQQEYRLAAQGKAYRIRLSPAMERATDCSLANFAVLEKLN
ncbi:hypothetical protein [Chitinilyticum piscinae]|uniref:Uncharacterized protein n=1 Tax=Chitinilyticum piscinae TaxID=2866724 RepID=A0A8J7FXZ8_9NEIS|nr:hypothetical protein [Chitinilyticum piscinae]MBE9607733.1 hypothetical protein [Chitinilyticum piscinae]